MTELDSLAGLDVELVGRRTYHWQPSAIATEHASVTPGWNTVSVNATAVSC